MLSIPDDDTVRSESVTYAIYFISAGLVIGTTTFMQVRFSEIYCETKSSLSSKMKSQ